MSAGELASGDERRVILLDALLRDERRLGRLRLVVDDGVVNLVALQAAVGVYPLDVGLQAPVVRLPELRVLLTDQPPPRTRDVVTVWW